MYRYTALAALVVATVATTAALCPSECTCTNGDTEVNCNGRGLQTIPQGTWSDAKRLYVKDNNISSLEADSLIGFPNIEYIVFSGNPIEILDLDFLTKLEKLESFLCIGCNITKVIPLAARLEVSNIRIISLELNKLASVSQNVLSGLTNENLDVDLSGNPLVLPTDRPLLMSSNLAKLKLNNINAGNLSKETFMELPNLQKLYLNTAGVTDVSDAMTPLTSLNYLELDNNPLQIIKKGFLSKEQKDFQRLDLEFADIEYIEIAAVDVMEKGVIYLTCTPLAVGCKYDDLYWWGQMKGIRIMAECPSQPPCEFSKK